MVTLGEDEDLGKKRAWGSKKIDVSEQLIFIYYYYLKLSKI